MNRSPEMRATALTLVLDLMRLYGLSVEDIRPAQEAPPAKPAGEVAPPAAYGARRTAIFELLKGAAPKGLSLAEISTRLDLPRQRLQVLLTGYRDAGYVTSSGPHGHKVWALNTSRPLPKAVASTCSVPPPPPPPKPAPPPAPASIPHAATGPGRVVVAQPPGPVLRIPGSARQRIALMPSSSPKEEHEVIIPPNVKRTVCPSPADPRYLVDPAEVKHGEFMRDWHARRGAQ